MNGGMNGGRKGQREGCNEGEMEGCMERKLCFCCEACLGGWGALLPHATAQL